MQVARYLRRVTRGIAVACHVVPARTRSELTARGAHEACLADRSEPGVPQRLGWRASTAASACGWRRTLCEGVRYLLDAPVSLIVVDAALLRLYASRAVAALRARGAGRARGGARPGRDAARGAVSFRCWASRLSPSRSRSATSSTRWSGRAAVSRAAVPRAGRGAVRVRTDPGSGACGLPWCWPWCGCARLGHDARVDTRHR